MPCFDLSSVPTDPWICRCITQDYAAYYIVSVSLMGFEKTYCIGVIVRIFICNIGNDHMHGRFRELYMSRDRKFPTTCYVRPASLRTACAYTQSDHLLVAYIFYES